MPWRVFVTFKQAEASAPTTPRWKDAQILGIALLPRRGRHRKTAPPRPQTSTGGAQWALQRSVAGPIVITKQAVGPGCDRVAPTGYSLARWRRHTIGRPSNSNYGRVLPVGIRPRTAKSGLARTPPFYLQKYGFGNSDCQRTRGLDQRAVHHRRISGQPEIPAQERRGRAEWRGDCAFSIPRSNGPARRPIGDRPNRCRGLIALGRRDREAIPILGGRSRLGVVGAQALACLIAAKTR